MSKTGSWFHGFDVGKIDLGASVDSVLIFIQRKKTHIFPHAELLACSSVEDGDEDRDTGDFKAITCSAAVTLTPVL